MLKRLGLSFTHVPGQPRDVVRFVVKVKIERDESNEEDGCKLDLAVVLEEDYT